MDQAEFEAAVLAAVPAIAAAVPPTPGAELGRLKLSPVDATPYGNWIEEAYRHFPALLAERLFGALELTVDGLDLRAPDELVAAVQWRETMDHGWAEGPQSEMRGAVAGVEGLRRGAGEVVLAVAGSLRARLAEPMAGDEKAIAAQHGATHLALAVAVSAGVLQALDVGRPPEIIGVALAAAAIVLATAPMPAVYAEAMREKEWAEYRMLMVSRPTTVVDHHFWLAEGPMSGPVDFAANGLVVALPGGVAVRTGAAEGEVLVTARMLETPLLEVDLDLEDWDDAVELSWTSTGRATLDPHVDWVWQGWTTPPWPGDLRMLVTANGRDDISAENESYEIQIWEAPFAPEVVHKRSDRVRGEPKADHPYRWVEQTHPDAASFTVVTGLSLADIVSAFGCDPASGRPLEDGEATWIGAVELPGAVLVIEDNGLVGTDADLLGALSRNGRAACMFWSVNMDVFAHFAREGEVVAEIDFDQPVVGPPEVLRSLAGMSVHGDERSKGVAAVARYTGVTFTESDLDRMLVYEIA